MFYSMNSQENWFIKLSKDTVISALTIILES